MGLCAVSKTNDESAYAAVDPNDEEEDPLFTIFRSSSAKCKAITSCECIERIANALKYYLSLDVLQTDYDNEHFITFCHLIYKSFLDDYIHIITIHNNDLLEIYEVMIEQYKLDKCDVNYCKMLCRHYDNNIEYKHSQIDDDSEADLTFYINLMDSIHMYVAHLYDTGMRVMHNNIKYNQLQDINNNNNVQCFDSVFCDISKTILDKKTELRSLHGFNQNKMISKKFNIDITYFDVIQDGLFMDRLFKFMLRNNDINQSEINRIKQLFCDEEYDSDAIMYDINSNNNSNTSQQFEDKQQYQFVKTFTNNTECETMHTCITPNIGCKFLYWDYYRDRTEHCFGGYKRCQLFVSCKYASFKEEILSNKVFALEINEYKIYSNKADKYMQSIKIKRTMCWVDEDPLHFDVEFGQRISDHNLLSIILYCDSIALSFCFASTFKKNNTFESIESIKNRNSEFYHWSKTLTETVEYFGDSFCRTNGCVYCAIPFMKLSEFYVKLNGVISTTKHIEVICMKSDINNSINNGIIVELNDSGTWQDFSLDSFCCAWISHYVEESEYLFCGGNYRIKIQSILNIQTKQNFARFFRTLFAFQFMVNGNDVEDFVTKPYIDNSDYNISNNLIKHKLNINGFKNMFPKYINDTFESFTNNMTQIVLHLDFIERYFKKLKELIIYPSNNNPKEIIWKLFPNVRCILIYSTDQYGQYTEYPLNLSALLCIISKVSLFTKNNIEIIIKATHKYEWNAAEINYEWEQRSWIFDVYSQLIETQFKNSKCYVDLKQITRCDEAGNQRKEDSLVITKFSHE